MGNDIDVLRERIAEDLGTDPSRWHEPDGYDSVALAVIDSIYSTGNRYAAVVNAVNRYRDARRESGANPDADTAADLVTATDAWGGAEGLVKRTNRWKVSTKAGAPTKAEAAYGAAVILDRHGLQTVEDVRRELTDAAQQEASPVKAEWLGLPGQRSGLTWTYFLMLCGVPGVKADRMVVRYVSRALGRDVDAREAAQLVGTIADELGCSRTVLDHAVWRCESGREVYLEDTAPSV